MVAAYLQGGVMGSIVVENVIYYQTVGPSLCSTQYRPSE